MSATYHIDFHIPVKELGASQDYVLESPQPLTAEQVLAALSERFANVRRLLSYGQHGRPPVALLVNGRSLAFSDVVPDGATVRIIGAVAGG